MIHQCSWCKRVKLDNGRMVERAVPHDAEVTHLICDDCKTVHFPHIEKFANAAHLVKIQTTNQ